MKVAMGVFDVLFIVAIILAFIFVDMTADKILALVVPCITMISLNLYVALDK